MQIDWFTVAAQIVNFLILVWLLQHFLYKPIVRAMDRREQRIADRLNDAREREQQASDEKREYEQEQEKLREERERILDEARDDAKDLREQLEEEIRGEAEERRKQWLNQIEEQRQNFLADLRERAAEHFSALARRVLADLADEQLEDRIAEVFVRKLRELDDELRERIAQAARRDERAVVVESAFELSSGRRAAITREIHECIADGIEVDYAITDSLAGGIRLRAGNVTAGWTLDSYLDDLEQRLEEELRGMKPADRPAAAG